MYKYKSAFALILTSTIFLSACGGSSGSSTSASSSTRTGVFLDSPVINIGYRTETLEGVTNALGEYEYIAGETVTFFIGDLEFPPVEASGIVTPLDIADTLDTNNSQVVNIIRLLQTLDQDGDPDNGITITETAIAQATQVDFTLSESDFAASTAVSALIVDAGQDNLPSELVSTSEAIAHFEEQLEENGLPSGSLAGTWLASNGENDFLQFTFFEDGTYLHAEVDLDDPNEVSGMEWGTYTRDEETGALTAASQRFDNNDDTGLTDFSTSTEALFFTVYGDVLELRGEDDSTFDFDRIESDGFVGTWIATNAKDDFLQFTFFDDGTYLHAEIDFDDLNEVSGMEWGTYTRNEETGELTAAAQTFDNNGDTGLTDFSAASDELIFTVNGDQLTLTVDEGRNEVIDSTLIFQRDNGRAVVSEFSSEWLAGKTLYDVWYGREDGFEGDDARVASISFDANGSNATWLGIYNSDIDASLTSTVDSDGKLYFGNDNGNRFEIYTCANSADYLEIIFTENGVIDNAERFYYDEENAQAFADSLSGPIPITCFTTSWLAGKTLYDVWYGIEDDFVGEDARIASISFNADASMATWLGIEESNIDVSINSFVDSEGKLYFSTTSEDPNNRFAINSCGNTPDFLEIVHTEDGEFDNRERFYYTEAQAREHWETLTETVPSNCR